MHDVLFAVKTALDAQQLVATLEEHDTHPSVQTVWYAYTLEILEESYLLNYVSPHLDLYLTFASR